MSKGKVARMSLKFDADEITARKIVKDNPKAFNSSAPFEVMSAVAAIEDALFEVRIAQRRINTGEDEPKAEREVREYLEATKQ